MSANGIYIGLMSGTSADAIDAVAVNFLDDHFHLLAHHSEPLTPEIRNAIHDLATPGDNEIDRLGKLDAQLGILSALCVNNLLSAGSLSAKQICAIGSHGQTIRHRPPTTGSYPFTLQIGDPNIIAQTTGITTVADFRRRDIAAGGQGAPLVPAFHQAAFHSSNCDRAIVNIGGIANVTWLPTNGCTLGFDTGPGNMLMDSWILHHQSKNYDASGNWAASGKVNEGLLRQLLNHLFFSQQPPKSTGREDFNSGWLWQELSIYPEKISAEDVQATLLMLTAHSITDAIKNLLESKMGEIYICGGGAYNKHLMTSIQTLLPQCAVNTTADLGIAPELVEAVAFAWLARQTLNRQSGNLCAVTGARQAVVLGGVYFA